jgi:hypothetical protein
MACDWSINERLMFEDWEQSLGANRSNPFHHIHAQGGEGVDIALRDIKHKPIGRSSLFRRCFLSPTCQFHDIVE